MVGNEKSIAKGNGSFLWHRQRTAGHAWAIRVFFARLKNADDIVDVASRCATGKGVVAMKSQQQKTMEMVMGTGNGKRAMPGLLVSS